MQLKELELKESVKELEDHFQIKAAEEQALTPISQDLVDHLIDKVREKQRTIDLLRPQPATPFAPREVMSPDMRSYMLLMHWTSRMSCCLRRPFCRLAHPRTCATMSISELAGRRRRAIFFFGLAGEIVVLVISAVLAVSRIPARGTRSSDAARLGVRGHCKRLTPSVASCASLADPRHS